MMKMRVFWVCVIACVAAISSAELAAQGSKAEEWKTEYSEEIAEKLAELKLELSDAVDSGELTLQEAIEKFAAVEQEVRAGREADAESGAFFEFAAKLKEFVAEGKLTRDEATLLYRLATEGGAAERKPDEVRGVNGSDYKIEGLEEQLRLSPTLPTTSTAGDQEGPVSTGFFGWAADATHRFMDNSHQGSPRLVRGLSFRLDYRDHDSIGRTWENVSIRIAHGDWSSIDYNASKEYSLVDEPVLVFDRSWSFPTLDGYPATEPAEWGGPQNALNFRFDEPFEYNGRDAIYVEFVFHGGVTEDGRRWEGDLPFGFEYFLDSMPESGGWRVAERPVGIYRSPRVEAVVSYTAGGQSVWTSSPKGMPYLKWEFDNDGE